MEQIPKTDCFKSRDGKLYQRQKAFNYGKIVYRIVKVNKDGIPPPTPGN